MAIVMSMYWPEVTKDKYEEVRHDVKWESEVPKGAKFHVAWFADDGFRVLDLWESQADFETFVRDRLTPGIQRAGLTSAPRVEFAPAHAVFAPDV